MRRDVEKQKEYREQLTNGIRFRDGLMEEVRRLRAKLDNLEKSIGKQVRYGSKLGKEKIRKEFERSSEELKEKLVWIDSCENDIAVLRGKLRAIDLSSELPQPDLSDRYPVLLFPVRLETRFMPADEAAQFLYVRIYPDQIAIDSHEEELSAEEVKTGRLCRERLREADSENLTESESEEKKKSAWRELARLAGPTRAAWILKKLSLYDNHELSKLNPSNSPQAPCVRIMPDYFIIRLYQGDQYVEKEGKPVRNDPLSVLWNPANMFELEDEELLDLFDDGSKWIMDFDAAYDEGMAVKVPLADIDYGKGFDRVIAIGVKTNIDEEKGVRLIEDLIDAHHYTDGIEFLRHGTPTNNTQIAESGYSQTRQNIEDQYDTEFFSQDTKVPEGLEGLWKRDGGNAERAEFALGIAAPDPNDHREENYPECPVFRHIRNANDVDASFSKQMQEGLWPSTWGYYFSRLLSDNLKSPIESDVVREHYRDFVRARGSLPSMRIGNLPYGILPVTKIRNWSPSEEDWWSAPDVSTTREQWLQTAKKMHGIFIKLFDLFLEFAADPVAIPKIGDSEDPDRELLSILAMEPGSVSCALRNVVPDEFVHALAWFAAPAYFGHGSIYEGLQGTPYGRVEEWTEIWQAQVKENAELLENRTGLSVGKDYPGITPRILQLFMWGGGRPLAVPLVAKPLKGEIDPSCTLGKFVEFSKQLDDHPDVVEKSIKILQLLPENTLDGLFRDCLDLSTHRLDAWITSLATRRLEVMRRHRNQAYRHGIYIGAYGWLENLHPKKVGRSPLDRGDLLPVGMLAAGETTMIPGSTIPSVRPDPGQIDSSQSFSREVPGGFIHAPSLGQAAAAAVLRGAYIASEEGGAFEASKVNLSSDRVRRALRIIDGIRQGQTLGVMLGIQFERALHDHFLDKYIDEFRSAFPLKAGRETKLQDGESVEAVAARNVVDGKKLAERWREILDEFDSPNPEMLSQEIRDLSDDDKEKLKNRLDRLVDSLDAVGDLWFTEAIYQGAQGCYERMGAALDAAAGAGPIPEVECVRTPRGGCSDTHRVCVLFASAYQVIDDPGDPRYAITSRALAEPNLAEWAEQVLGDPKDILCKASAPSTDIATEYYSLAKLQISALDFVYLSSTPPSGEESELEQLIRYKFRTEYGLGVKTEIKIGFDRVDLDNQPAETRSMGEAIEVARSLLQVIGKATWLHPSMLCLPEEASTDETEDDEAAPNSNGNMIGVFNDTDYSELENRVARAIAGLQAVIDEVIGDEVEDAVTNENNIKNLDLDKARKFGVPNTIPSSGEGEAELESRKQAVYEELVKRNKKAETLRYEAVVNQANGLIDSAVCVLTESMKAIFGNGFTVLPAFSVPRADELKNALGLNVRTQGSETHILGGQGQDRIWLWLQQAAQTHPALCRFENALMTQQAWGNKLFDTDADCEPEEQNFQIAQLPFREIDRWVALAKSEDPDDHLSVFETREQGCLSLMIHAPLSADFPVPVDSTTRIAGILIDQWEERIPNKEEVSGIAFHYDQPNAQAPHALLLAVPGEWNLKKRNWSYADLFETVYDTMDLYKVRLVDLDALRKVGQFLPALFLPKLAATFDAGGSVKIEKVIEFER